MRSKARGALDVDASAGGAKCGRLAGEAIIDVRSLLLPGPALLSSASNPRLLLFPPAANPSPALDNAPLDPSALKLSENGSRSVPSSTLPLVLAATLLPPATASFLGLLGALTAGPTRTPIPEIPAEALAVLPIGLMALLPTGTAGSPCGTTICLPSKAPNSLTGARVFVSPNTALREMPEVVEEVDVS